MPQCGPMNLRNPTVKSSPLTAPLPTGRRRGWVAAALLGLVAGMAQAQTSAELEALSLRWAQDALRGAAASDLPLRMEVQIGQLDSRLKLAACAKVEPYLPAGSRLWGRTRVGLRCVQGPSAWNVFLPLTVQAFGPAWVLSTNTRQGAVLTASDATVSEVDWAEQASPVVARQQAWLGQEAARHLQAGQVLRQDMLRSPQLFPMGAQVKVSVSGGGFSVVSSGRAMAAGAEGANVRVRMDNGRLVTGVVNAEGVVEVP
ncbi:Flagella basal body P-ring formation protein FlgA precursor [compost metagenome]